MSLIGWESGLSISNKAQLDSHGECGAIARRLINSSDGYFRLHSFFFFFFLFFWGLARGRFIISYFYFWDVQVGFWVPVLRILGDCAGMMLPTTNYGRRYESILWFPSAIVSIRFFSNPLPPQKKKCKKNLKRILWLRLVSLF